MRPLLGKSFLVLTVLAVGALTASADQHCVLTGEGLYSSSDGSRGTMSYGLVYDMNNQFQVYNAAASEILTDSSGRRTIRTFLGGGNGNAPESGWNASGWIQARGDSGLHVVGFMGAINNLSIVTHDQTGPVNFNGQASGRLVCGWR